MSNQPHGRGAGQWSVTLPTAASYSQGLAYGKGGSPLPDTWVDVDDVVQPMLADARVDQPKKKVARKHRTSEAAPQPESQPQSQPEQQAPVAPAASSERTELALADTAALSSYEARQSQSQEQQKFRGGSAIIIGASTLVVVLLVVLLIVLLL